jgi:hypothetical protein
VAIGAYAGQTNQAQNSIIINAAGSALNCSTASCLLVDPIRSTANSGTVLVYDTTTKEIQYNNSNKTFVIDHPQDPSKLLVHACLEGPEAAVYYRGKTYVDHVATIELPEYARAFDDFTVQVTPINNPSRYMVSEVDNNKFTVSLEESSYIHWLVMGTREHIKVEVDRSEVQVHGSGPYKYLASL